MTRIIVGALAALLLASCGNSGSDPDTATTTDWGPLAVVPGGTGGDDALASGHLAITNECVQLETPNGERELLIWPSDTTEWSAEERTVTFKKSSGETVTFQDGDAVSLGGGGSSEAEDRETAEAFLDRVTWTAEPRLECVTPGRWFISDADFE